MSVRTWPEATEGRNPLILASSGRCCQQSAVTRLQLSATRVHAPSDSHNLDTDCGGQGWPSHPLPHASPTQYGDWQRNFERVFISLADTPGPEGKGIMVMDWRSAFCPLIASIVPGTRATYRGRVMASSYHRSPKEMKDCKVDGFINCPFTC